MAALPPVWLGVQDVSTLQRNGPYFFAGYVRFQDVLHVMCCLHVQRAETQRKQDAVTSMQQRLGARYVPGGKAQSKDLQKSSLDACLLHLHATLSHDWPLSYVQVCIGTAPMQGVRKSSTAVAATT